jgi:predicted RNA-binding protein YlqC (UPF0109 family)
MLSNNQDNNLTDALKPDYDGLVRFLIEPLLESPHLLSFDCEQLSSTKRVWIRLAFDDNEKGKIYGRGGRNIQAIRTTLEAAAQLAGDTLYLEVYDAQSRSRTRGNRPQTRPRASLSPQLREGDNGHGRRPIRRRREHYKSSNF